MKKFKSKNGTNAIRCMGPGAIMIIENEEIEDKHGAVDFVYSTNDQVKDTILIGLAFNRISILTEVNSDHIAIMKEIIKKYEGGFKQ